MLQGLLVLHNKLRSEGPYLPPAGHYGGAAQATVAEM